MKDDRERDTAVRELVHALVDAAPPAPPFPDHDTVPRTTRGARAAIAAFVVLALVAGAVAFVAQQSSRDTRPTNVTSAPAPATTPKRLAYVGRAGLIVVDSPGHESVVVKGAVSNPAWSYDGKWLAFERPGAFNHVLNGRELWVVASSGGAARRLLYNLDQWSWSRSNPSALAVVNADEIASVIFADGSTHWKAPIPGVTGIAWANRAGTVAIATAERYGPRLYLANVFGHVPVAVRRVDYQLAIPPVTYTLRLDRFRSDDRTVLAWVNTDSWTLTETYAGPLIAIPVAGGDAIRYPTTLVKPSWVRDAPTGTDLLIVVSSGRSVTGPRQVRRCDSAGQCLVPFVAGVQTMDPAWSPDGARIAYIRSDASRSGSVPAGASTPLFPGPDRLPAFYESRHLWVAAADGTHARQVYNPAGAVLGWSDATHVLAVDDGRVTSVDVATGATGALTGRLGQKDMTLPTAAANEPTSGDGSTSWESLIAVRP